MKYSYICNMVEKSGYVKLPLFVAFDIKPEAENGSDHLGELVCLP